MRKRFWFFGIVLLGASFVISCSSSDKDNNNTNGNETKIEENKAKVEDAGLSILADGQDLVNEPGVQISQQFVELTENLKVGGTPAAGTVSIAPINTIANLEGVDDLMGLGSLKEDGTEPVEEDISMMELFEMKGIYTYNFETQGWDFEAGGDVVLFMFPASAADQTNNATIKISKLNVNIIDQEEVPTDIEVEMKKDDMVILGFSYAADIISGNDLPQSFMVHVLFSGFEFNFNESITNNITFVSELELKKDGGVILDVSLGGSGDFSVSELNQEPPDYFNTAEFSINIGNIMLKGDGNMKAIHDGEVALRNEYEGKEDTYANAVEREKKMVQLVNDNMSLYLGFSDATETIADMEFVVLEDQDEFGTYFYVDVQMVFADGSKVDSETYFGQMLDKFLAELTGIETTLES